MKIKNIYITRDGKKHDSIKQAESHCLANAHTELKSLIDDSNNNKVQNSYLYSQMVINNPDSLKRLESIVRWLRDYESTEEKEIRVIVRWLRDYESTEEI